MVQPSDLHHPVLRQGGYKVPSPWKRVSIPNLPSCKITKDLSQVFQGVGVHPQPTDHPELPSGELPPEPPGGGGGGRLPSVELAIPRGEYRHLSHVVHQHDPGGKGAQAGHLYTHVPGSGIQGGGIQ